MKVEKLKKISSNKYEVLFDNRIRIKLYDDIIVKYNLLLKRELIDNDFLLMEKDNENLKAYYEALGYIKRRMRSEEEIKKYLLDKEYELVNVDKIIERLKKENYLNEEVFVSAFIMDRVNLSNDGYYKIMDDLKKCNVDEDKIRKKLEIVEDSQWEEKLRKIISKKIKANHKYSGNRLKQKICFELINLGYPKEMIDSLLDDYDFKDNAILEKEFNKISQRLEKRYQGKELNYQIRNKLFQKGFNTEDINSYFSEE